MPVSSRLVSSELRAVNRGSPFDESLNSAARQKLFVVNSSELLIVPQCTIVVLSLCRVQITKWLADWIRKLSYLCNFCGALCEIQEAFNVTSNSHACRYNYVSIFAGHPIWIRCRAVESLESGRRASCAYPLVCRLWIIQDVSELIRPVYHYDTLRCFKIFLSVLCSLFSSATSVAAIFTISFL